MKAIAFAIVFAAYLLIPASEAALWHPVVGKINAVMFLICMIGFWLCLVFEK